jgi:hypothetical protein
MGLVHEPHIGQEIVGQPERLLQRLIEEAAIAQSKKPSESATSSHGARHQRDNVNYVGPPPAHRMDCIRRSHSSPPWSLSNYALQRTALAR